MKKLQNNFTTPEQSKRLLELGMPEDSADCYYSHYIKTYAHSLYTEILWHRPRFITEDNKPVWNAILMDGTQTYLPCWSVGRLIEIYELCYAQEFIRNVGAYLMEDVLSTIYDAVNDTTEQWDFSKLEK